MAAFKRSEELFVERGLRARLLAAAYRNQLQWTELVGCDVVLSPPFAWQERFQASRHHPVDRIGARVEPRILASLGAIREFRWAYGVDGMSPEEFDTFGATRTTTHQFLSADEELDQIFPDVLLPQP